MLSQFPLTLILGQEKKSESESESEGVGPLFHYTAYYFHADWDSVCDLYQKCFVVAYL